MSVFAHTSSKFGYILAHSISVYVGRIAFLLSGKKKSKVDRAEAQHWKSFGLGLLCASARATA